MILSLTTEYAFGPHDLEKALAENSIASVDGFQLMSSLDKSFNLSHYELTCWLPESSFSGIKEFLAQNPSKNISSIHAYAPLRPNFRIGDHPADFYNLSSCNPKKRGIAVDALVKTIELASELDAKRVVVHAGFKERNCSRQDNLSALLNSIEDCLPIAEKTNVVIGIENGLYPSQISVCSSEIKQLSKFYPQAGLWLDSGHAFVNKSSDLYQIVEECPEIIVGFHLHNNNGKKDLHASLEDGKIDFNRVLNPLKSRIKSGQIPVVLEIYNYRSNSSPEKVKDSIQLVRDIIYS